MEMINATGRRKASVARVYFRDGKGKITINGKDYKEYFPLEYLRYNIEDPLATVEASSKYDIYINLSGGGVKGQAEAAKMAIARALAKIDEDNRPPLKAKGYFHRDARVVERKKYGKPKARKSFQFSKR